MTCQGPQRARSICCSLNFGLPARMERDSRSKNYEEGDGVRYRHADSSVDRDSSKLCDRLRRLPLECGLSGIDANILRFLRTLPEEKIRTDGRSEYSNDCHPILGLPCKRRKYRGLKDGSPRNVHHKCSSNVSKQN